MLLFVEILLSSLFFLFFTKVFLKIFVLSPNVSVLFVDNYQFYKVSKKLVLKNLLTAGEINQTFKK